MPYDDENYIDIEELLKEGENGQKREENIEIEEEDSCFEEM